MRKTLSLLLCLTLLWNEAGLAASFGRNSATPPHLLTVCSPVFQEQAIVSPVLFYLRSLSPSQKVAAILLIASGAAALGHTLKVGYADSDVITAAVFGWWGLYSRLHQWSQERFSPPPVTSARWKPGDPVQDPFAHLLPGTEVFLGDLLRGLEEKALTRHLMDGGPIAQPAFFAAMARDQDAIEAAKLRYGPDQFRDVSYPEQLIPPAKVISFPEIAARLASGEFPSLVIKPNSSATGAGIVFFDLRGNKLQITTSLIREEEGEASVFTRTFMDYFHQRGYHIKPNVRQGIVQVTVPLTDALPTLLTGLWTSLSQQSAEKLFIYDSYIAETRVPFVRLSDGAYETRHTFQGDLLTGKVKFPQRNGFYDGWLARFGSSFYFSNNLTRRPPGFAKQIGPLMFAPLFKRFGIDPEHQGEFLRYVEAQVRHEFLYLSERLRAGGLALDLQVSGGFDLRWLPPEKSGGFPGPVLIEMRIVPDGEPNLSDVVRISPPVNDIAHLLARLRGLDPVAAAIVGVLGLFVVELPILYFLGTISHGHLLGIITVAHMAFGWVNALGILTFNALFALLHTWLESKDPEGSPEQPVRRFWRRWFVSLPYLVFAVTGNPLGWVPLAIQAAYDILLMGQDVASWLSQTDYVRLGRGRESSWPHLTNPKSQQPGKQGWKGFKERLGHFIWRLTYGLPDVAPPAWVPPPWRNAWQLAQRMMLYLWKLAGASDERLLRFAMFRNLKTALDYSDPDYDAKRLRKELGPTPIEQMRAIEAIQYSGKREILELALMKAFHPHVRRAAARKLGELGDAAAIPSLEASIRNDSEPIVVVAAQTSLSQISSLNPTHVRQKNETPPQVESNRTTRDLRHYIQEPSWPRLFDNWLTMGFYNRKPIVFLALIGCVGLILGLLVDPGVAHSAAQHFIRTLPFAENLSQGRALQAGGLGFGLMTLPSLSSRLRFFKENPYPALNPELGKRLTLREINGLIMVARLLPPSADERVGGEFAIDTDKFLAIGNDGWYLHWHIFHKGQLSTPLLIPIDAFGHLDKSRPVLGERLKKRLSVSLAALETENSDWLIHQIEKQLDLQNEALISALKRRESNPHYMVRQLTIAGEPVGIYEMVRISPIISLEFIRRLAMVIPWVILLANQIIGFGASSIPYVIEHPAAVREVRQVHGVTPLVELCSA